MTNVQNNGNLPAIATPMPAATSETAIRQPRKRPSSEKRHAPVRFDKRTTLGRRASELRELYVRSLGGEAIPDTLKVQATVAAERQALAEGLRGRALRGEDDPDDVKKSETVEKVMNPEAELEKLARAESIANGITYAKAYTAVLDNPDGRALYLKADQAPPAIRPTSRSSSRLTAHPGPTDVEEMGSRLNFRDYQTHYYDTAAIKDEANADFHQIGSYKGLKALARAQWESTQYLLDKANMATVNVYRSLSLDMPIGNSAEEGNVPLVPTETITRLRRQVRPRPRQALDAWAERTRRIAVQHEWVALIIDGDDRRVWARPKFVDSTWQRRREGLHVHQHALVH
jgi:hypothetical protein